MLFENEGTPVEPQEDAIWVLDGRGELVKVEVLEDADDN